MANAVERRTASGALLGPDEAITAAQALEAVTLGSARLLKMDHEVGSIEGGKLADLAVLDDDPLAVPVDRIRHLGVVATMLGGKVLPVEATQP
jgi:predicted amidohydrolase YtcJ